MWGWKSPDSEKQRRHPAASFSAVFPEKEHSHVTSQTKTPQPDVPTFSFPGIPLSILLPASCSLSFSLPVHWLLDRSLDLRLILFNYNYNNSIRKLLY